MILKLISSLNIQSSNNSALSSFNPEILGDLSTLIASEVVKSCRGLGEQNFEANNTLLLYLMYFNRVFFCCENFAGLDSSKFVTTSPRDLYRPILVPFVQRIVSRFTGLLENLAEKEHILKVQIIKLGVYVLKYEYEFVNRFKPPQDSALKNRL